MGQEPGACGLPVTSVGVFSDMLSSCKEDGLVPKAKPRDILDFSLYTPATKPCCFSPYKGPRMRALAFTGLAFLPLFGSSELALLSQP